MSMSPPDRRRTGRPWASNTPAAPQCRAAIAAQPVTRYWIPCHCGFRTADHATQLDAEREMRAHASPPPALTEEHLTELARWSA